MASSNVKPLDVHLARSSAYSSGVSTLAIWLLCLLRSGNSSSAGKRSFCVLWLLEKGMAAATGCRKAQGQRRSAHQPPGTCRPLGTSVASPGRCQGQRGLHPAPVHPWSRAGPVRAPDSTAARDTPVPHPSAWRPARLPPTLGPAHQDAGQSGDAECLTSSRRSTDERRPLAAPELLRDASPAAHWRLFIAHSFYWSVLWGGAVALSVAAALDTP